MSKLHLFLRERKHISIEPLARVGQQQVLSELSSVVKIEGQLSSKPCQNPPKSNKGIKTRKPALVAGLGVFSTG